MIDRDLLRACIAYEDGELIDRPDVPDTTAYILEAARLVADPDTLILHGKDGTAIRTDIEMVVNRWCPGLNDYAVSQASLEILNVLEAAAQSEEGT